MRYLLSSSNTTSERFADLCSQVRELKNSYDLVAILVDDRKAGSSGSTSARSLSQVPPEHASASGSYNRLQIVRQVLTDDASVLGDEDLPSSSNSAIVVNAVYRQRRYILMDKIRRAVVERAAAVGFILPKSRLPWKQLPERCARHGVYIDNYPDSIVSPFGNERKTCDHGIKALTNDDREALLHALTSEKIYPMQFKSERRLTDILNNREPVIVYAPPPSGSAHERSKRIFLDGSYDYQGHPRIESLPANGETARKRCSENPLAEKPEKRRRVNQGIQGSQPHQPAVRTLAPVHPITRAAETRSSVETSYDFLRPMEGRIFNYVFTYAERTMHIRDSRQ